MCCEGGRSTNAFKSRRGRAERLQWARKIESLNLNTRSRLGAYPLAGSFCMATLAGEGTARGLPNTRTPWDSVVPARLVR